MNKTRRKELMEWVQRVEKWTAQGESLKYALENICDDEQDYFNSMPEGFQCGQRGMDAEDAIDAMNEAMESIDIAIDSAEESISCIMNI